MRTFTLFTASFALTFASFALAQADKGKVYKSINIDNHPEVVFDRTANSANRAAEKDIDYHGDCYPPISKEQGQEILNRNRKAEGRYNATLPDDSAQDNGYGILQQYTFCDRLVVIGVTFVPIWYNDGTRSRSNGWLSLDETDYHINKLNEDFKQRGVLFYHKATRPFEFSTLANWQAYTVPSDNTYVAAQKLSQLVRGDFSTRSLQDLFVYSVYDTPGAAAFATIPDSWEYNNQAVKKSDGVYFTHSYLRNGANFRPTDLAHEVGHWLNLFHTFETFDRSITGCGGLGDFVYDTIPWQGSASSQPVSQFRTCEAYVDYTDGGYVNPCPSQNPSATQSAMRAAIANIMSYSFPLCTYQFTPGQIKRVMVTLTQYRGFSYNC